ncbi:unnamed protein product [Caenorhabditis brenneri]
MKTLELLLFHIFIALLSALAPAALDQDWGLEKACNKTGGTFTKRENALSYTGDTCDFKFRVATREGDDGAAFCELYAPWRVRKITHSKEGTTHYTTCHVEATLMCHEGWWQMFGWCFRMPDKHNRLTRPDAEALCAKEIEGGEIAYMHHRYIAGVWRRYFKGTGQIWVSASESWDRYVQKTYVDGSALALAFTGHNYDYSVTANSLVRVDPSIKHQILCQYKPPMSNAEIAYLGRRYSEIYYPSVPVHDGILIRSASSYTSSTSNLDICEKTLKPFLAPSVGTFIPDNEAIAEMGNVKLPFVMTRSGAEALLHIIHMNETGCQYVNGKFTVKVPGLMKGDYELKNFPTAGMTCDNMKSVAVMHSPGKAELRVMSDSRSMPVWCKLGQTKKYRYNISQGYELFERLNGGAVSHRLYLGKVNYTVADDKCKEDGAFLSGVNSLKEANALGALAKKAGKEGQFWLGAKRREECKFVKGYTKERGQTCSRENVVQWQNGVATEFLDNWWRDGHKRLDENTGEEYTPTNPSSDGKSGLKWLQDCITYVSGTPYWADADTNRFLDDIGCDSEAHGFFCTKKVEIVADIITGT